VTPPPPLFSLASSPLLSILRCARSRCSRYIRPSFFLPFFLVFRAPKPSIDSELVWRLFFLLSPFFSLAFSFSRRALMDDWCESKVIPFLFFFWNFSSGRAKRGEGVGMEVEGIRTPFPFASSLGKCDPNREYFKTYFIFSLLPVFLFYPQRHRGWNKCPPPSSCSTGKQSRNRALAFPPGLLLAENGKIRESPSLSLSLFSCPPRVNAKQ